MFKWKYDREPTSPGEILKEEYLTPLGLTQKQCADHLHVDIKVINRIVNGKTSVTTQMAVKLGAAFGTSAEFWINSQTANDLWKLKKSNLKLPGLLTTNPAASEQLHH